MVCEYVFRIGIKKSEIPYIENRIKELGIRDGKGLLTEFTNYVDRKDDMGLGDWMSGNYAKDYERIRDEILAKREDNLCPFCSEVVSDLNKHIRKYHREEIVRIYSVLTKKDINMARKELILESFKE